MSGDNLLDKVKGLYDRYRPRQSEDVAGRRNFLKISVVLGIDAILPAVVMAQDYNSHSITTKRSHDILSSFIQPNSKNVSGLMDKIRKDYQDLDQSQDKNQIIATELRKSVDYDYSKLEGRKDRYIFRPPEITLGMGKGKCLDISLTYVSMLRNAGVDAKVVESAAHYWALVEGEHFDISGFIEGLDFEKAKKNGRYWAIRKYTILD